MAWDIPPPPRYSFIQGKKASSALALLSESVVDSAESLSSPLLLLPLSEGLLVSAEGWETSAASSVASSTEGMAGGGEKTDILGR